MKHPGESLPGWSLGYTHEGGCPYAKLETESGRFTATWYVYELLGARQAYVVFNEYYICSISRERQTGPARAIGWFPADEIVGQCLLFDTKEG
jgi:hypothetical protein